MSVDVHNLIDNLIGLLRGNNDDRKQDIKPGDITSDSDKAKTENIPELRRKYNYNECINNTQNFPKLLNDNILKTCNNKIPDHIPVWLHRQAGRYMKVFRELRKKYDFFTICKTPELVCEVTLQPINKYKLDASIIFSDILVIPPLFGFKCVMIKGKGPTFELTLNNDVYNDTFGINKYTDEYIKNMVTRGLNYVYKGITLTRHGLKGKVPLIGFCGDPFTLFCYITEGGGSKNWFKTKKLLVQYPDMCVDVLNKLSLAIAYHLINQINAGAQLVEIFGSLHGILPPQLFRKFIMPCLKNINKIIKDNIKNKNIPIILFAREVNVPFNELTKLGYNILAVGWGKDCKIARKEAPNAVLQGNLDPMSMFKNKNELKLDIFEMLTSFGMKKNQYGKSKLIVNLGHGMMPGMSEESVETLINSVREYETKYL